MKKIIIKIIISGLFLLHEVPMFSKVTCGKSTQDHSITIFVHGTFPARKTLQYSFGRFLIYCPQGLSLAKNLPSYYHFHKMANGCVQADPCKYNLDQFYVFGWPSEHIYDYVRLKAAQDLVNQLEIIVQNYYQVHKVIPTLRLLGFSHGGNVVLYTAKFLPVYVEGKPVPVEAWLFGTPVQMINKDLVNSDCFAKVYSFYSKKDWLQRMDPQGLRSDSINLKKIWSDRTFDDTDRCIQVDFMVNGKSISHTYYRSIFKYFPHIQKMVEKKSENIDSGHISIDFHA
ncbi:MAG: hypothetical protein ACXWL2_00180 [Candidatus Chromulinivorax sp.]